MASFVRKQLSQVFRRSEHENTDAADNEDVPTGAAGIYPLARQQARQSAILSPQKSLHRLAANSVKRFSDTLRSKRQLFYSDDLSEDDESPETSSAVSTAFTRTPPHSSRTLECSRSLRRLRSFYSPKQRQSMESKHLSPEIAPALTEVEIPSPQLLDIEARRFIKGHSVRTVSSGSTGKLVSGITPCPDISQRKVDFPLSDTPIRESSGIMDRPSPLVPSPNMGPLGEWEKRQARRQSRYEEAMSSHSIQRAVEAIERQTGDEIAIGDKDGPCSSSYGSSNSSSDEFSSFNDGGQEFRLTRKDSGVSFVGNSGTPDEGFDGTRERPEDATVSTGGDTVASYVVEVGAWDEGVDPGDSLNEKSNQSNNHKPSCVRTEHKSEDSNFSFGTQTSSLFNYEFDRYDRTQERREGSGVSLFGERSSYPNDRHDSTRERGADSDLHLCSRACDLPGGGCGGILVRREGLGVQLNDSHSKRPLARVERTSGNSRDSDVPFDKSGRNYTKDCGLEGSQEQIHDLANHYTRAALSLDSLLTTDSCAVTTSGTLATLGKSATPEHHRTASIHSASVDSPSSLVQKFKKIALQGWSHDDTEEDDNLWSLFHEDCELPAPTVSGTIKTRTRSTTPTSAKDPLTQANSSTSLRDGSDSDKESPSPPLRRRDSSPLSPLSRRSRFYALALPPRTLQQELRGSALAGTESSGWGTPDILLD